jgi:GNAT superfamily N-acetyltransferase
MYSENLKRMIQLAEEVFAVKTDPNQLDVNQEVIERLKEIHPATLSEYDDGNGPVAWILLIPSTQVLMEEFLEGKISEKQLFDLTPLNETYNSIYLCSAMVLEEYRRQGIAKRLTLDAINNIRKDHPITSLFVWPFSAEGDLTSETLSGLTSLPLFKRSAHK